MSHYGLMNDYRFDDAVASEDVRGAKIYGRNDEKLGSISDVIFDHATGAVKYVVVDASGWFSNKKFLVPPHRLHTSAQYRDDFSVNLDKETIENLPRYKESDLDSGQKWNRYQKKFDAAWHAGPVQHRRGSDRNISPTSEEAPPEPGSIASRMSADERERVRSRVIPPLSNDVTIQHNATGIGDRWSTFEERLRQRRREITRACRTCTVEPVSDRPSETAA